nr:hypothetical protein [Mangrovicoccus ximenensis]
MAGEGRNLGGVAFRQPSGGGNQLAERSDQQQVERHRGQHHHQPAGSGDGPHLPAGRIRLRAELGTGGGNPVDPGAAEIARGRGKEALTGRTAGRP